MLGPTVERGPFPAVVEVRLPAEFGGDDHLLAERSEGFADELFVGERAIDFGGVEKGDAELDGGMEERDHLGLVLRRAVGPTHAHAAEADRGDFEIVVVSEFALLHRCSLRVSLDPK